MEFRLRYLAALHDLITSGRKSSLDRVGLAIEAAVPVNPRRHTIGG